MPAYYNTPLYYAAPSPAYVPAPRLTVPSYHHTASYNHAPTTRTYTYYPNHRGRGGPYHPNHIRTAGPPNHNHRWTVAGPQNQNHKFVAQAHAPAVVYSTPPPPPPPPMEAEAEADARAHTATLAYPARRRRLLLDPSRTPTQNDNDAHAPYENCNYVLYSTKTCGPIYNTQYEYVPPVTWPALGPPHTPQALGPTGPGWAPRRTLRIAFDLAGRVPGKEGPRHEGVPLAMLLRVSQGTLRGLVEGALARVLPYIYPPPAQGVTLRFWSPVHPYAVQEYTVTRDAREHYTKRLTLALHVARAYDRAAFAVPESTQRSSSNDKNHFRVKAIGPRRVALDDLWLVALRGTEREDVFDVCVHYHPDSRPELVYD